MLSLFLLPIVRNIRTFLDVTRLTAEGLAVNISNFLEENDRIIRNISLIISNLEDMHSLINRVGGRERRGGGGDDKGRGGRKEGLGRKAW